jgi:hypothetical protein
VKLRRNAARAGFSGHSTVTIALLLPFDPASCDKFFEIQRQRPMTKAIIFDLDGCLAAADEVGEQLFRPAFAAIRAANDGNSPVKESPATLLRMSKWLTTRDNGSRALSHLA